MSFICITLSPGRTDLSSSAGEAPSLRVIWCDTASVRVRLQAASNDTNSEHGRHLGESGRSFVSSADIFE